MIPAMGFPSALLLLMVILSNVLASLLPFDLFPHGRPDGRTAKQPGAVLSEETMVQSMFESLMTMQDRYFEHWMGTWPTAIDWTAAVMETILAGSLHSIAVTISSPAYEKDVDWRMKENLIDTFFDQVVGSYYGQDALAIRQEAYDDMLWVVLGWLEAIEFAHLHDERHYTSEVSHDAIPSGIEQILANTSWHGTRWIPTFAHRTRVFWDVASKGWDTRLCRGGMTWNPRLSPYKNAITNELWIAASIKMYLHFPGDDISSPWLSTACFRTSARGGKPGTLPPCPPRDPKFLAAAVDGYKWLMSSGMMNKQGLFADGFHISKIKEGGTECDLLEKMVYTYNQGVLLTGCRGLFQATGAKSYLEDGHELIRNVILATGWDISAAEPIDNISSPGSVLPPWHGLGRAGVLEEKCDAKAICTQNAQIFKGIFFHHLIEFCMPFSEANLEDLRNMLQDPSDVIEMHRQACISYSSWVNHNARAALLTRDKEGRFGMWWTVGLLGWDLELPRAENQLPKHWVDYRSLGLPDDGLWQEAGTLPLWTPEEGNTGIIRGKWFVASDGDAGNEWSPIPDDDEHEDGMQQVLRRKGKKHCRKDCGDPNKRGRGRTAETQAGGVSVLRAACEFSQL